jgi:putative ABC transport system permease protein
VEALWQDVRFGLRMLMKNHGFSVVAILTLALGIGANTAIFSVVNAVLLRGLPYPEPQRLAVVQETVIGSGPEPVAYPNYLEMREQNHVFSDLAAYAGTDFTVSGDEKTDRIAGELTSDNYFPLLGVTPVMGRSFLPEENKVPGTHAVAMIGFGLWQRRFGQDSAILGRQLKINGVEYNIVGVLPRGFHGLTGDAEVWIPIAVHDAAWPESAKFGFLTGRDIHWHRVIGRLKPGVSVASANAEVEALAARMEREYPKENKGRGARVLAASEYYVGRVRPALLALLGAVGFVLLIACSNVANLLLVRAAAREREFAIRIALGAGRGRLLTQLLVECLLIALTGGILGLALAFWGVQALPVLLPLSLPSFARVGVDSQVFLFTAVISIFTGMLLGVLPAMHAFRQNIGESLKEGAKSSEGNRARRIGALIVVSEIALAIVPMIGAGLMLRSLDHLLHSDLGFRPDHLLTMRIDVPHNYTGDSRVLLSQRIAERLRNVPGVESVSASFIDPFIWGGMNRGFTLEGHAPITGVDVDAVACQEADPDYFRTMGIPLREGREFAASDLPDAAHVLMVNEAFARRFWPGEEVLGKRIKYGPADSTRAWMPIVGVVGNSKFESLRQDAGASPVIYGPLEQSEMIADLNLMIRTKVEPSSLAPALRAEIAQMDSNIPVFHVATLEERIKGSSSNTRSLAMLLALFAVLALVLSSIGIYSVISYGVARRTNEIGVRIALGAQQHDVLKLILGQGLRLAILGVGIGTAGSLALTRLLSSLLFGISATDPITFGGVALLLAIVALLACYLPARRAMRVDPMVALRYE